MHRNGISLLQSFANNPSLLAPEHAPSLRALAEVYGEDNGRMASLMRSLTSTLGLGSARTREEITSPNSDALCAAFGMGASDRSKPFAFADGMAIIPMWGTLLHRDSYCDSYATGYDYIQSKFSAALADPDVKGIVFDVNSPGGHVRGNFELADMIYESRSRKPSLAVVDGGAYSGGYSLGSSATRMVLAPSSGAGSIGVLMMHASVEEMLSKWGISITMIHAGAHKVDGNPFQNLPDDVRARFQASIERSYDKFVSLVARNRGIEADAVRATEASCYDADEALSLGLIDAIQTPAAALAAFRMELDGSDTNPNLGAPKMSNATATGGDGTATVTTDNKPADTVAAPAATTPVVVAPVVAAPAADDDAKAERTRCQGIIGCEEAKGRESLANHLAFNTTMSVEDARAALAAAPLATAAAAGGNAFAAAMEGTTNPNVGASGGGDDETANAPRVGDRLARSYQAATGTRLRVLDGDK